MSQEKLKHLASEMNSPKRQLIRIAEEVEAENKKLGEQLGKLIMKLEILQWKISGK